MSILLDPLFFLTLSLLFCHELDAIRHHEWRLFAFLNRLDNERAYRLFILLHIPLFGLVFWFVAYPAVGFVIFVDVFVMVHLGLHRWFRAHPHYEFQGFVSNLFIVGAAATGAGHLLLLLTIYG